VALRLNAPGASTRNRGPLEDGHRHAAAGERHGSGHAGIPGTNDCYAATQVFHAIQNLRSGVSEVRWRRTRKPSRCISSRSVR
jgi:hypothetical protein